MQDKANAAQVQSTTGFDGQDVKRGAFRIHQARLNRQCATPPLQPPPIQQRGIPPPQHSESLPDKPLPSLPITTVHPKSPTVRCSLIDASEKSLRKSLSPSPGVEEHEGWLAI